MDAHAIIARLQENRPALQARGIVHAAVFGSRARGDARPDSDIDILIDIDPDKAVDLWAYAGLKLDVADLFDGPVDVVSRASMKPHVLPNAMADAIYAF